MHRPSQRTTRKIVTLILCQVDRHGASERLPPGSRRPAPLRCRRCRVDKRSPVSPLWTLDIPRPLYLPWKHKANRRNPNRKPRSFFPNEGDNAHRDELLMIFSHVVPASYETGFRGTPAHGGRGWPSLPWTASSTAGGWRPSAAAIPATPAVRLPAAPGSGSSRSYFRSSLSSPSVPTSSSQWHALALPLLTRNSGGAPAAGAVREQDGVTSWVFSPLLLAGSRAEIAQSINSLSWWGARSVREWAAGSLTWKLSG